jgi:hypothetical protein
MSIVDGTHLPNRLNEALSKDKGERTSIEFALIVSYQKKYGELGPEAVADVAKIEAIVAKQSVTGVCRSTGDQINCNVPSIIEKHKQ